MGSQSFCHQAFHVCVERDGGGDLGGDDATPLIDQRLQRFRDAWHFVEARSIGQDVQEVADQRRCSWQELVDGRMLRGVVHDPTARRMGGVAGHAGLFTTVADLSKYARMLLRGGSPIFRPEIVNMMTTVQSPPNVAVRRAGGTITTTVVREAKPAA